MPKQRQYSGDETTETLSNWKKDQKSAERLASSLLRLDNFSDIDPSHPMGGRDGTKDIICKKGDKTFIVAVYFPRTTQAFTTISKKIQQDFAGVTKNKVDGIVFFTNQHLTIGERAKIKKAGKSATVEIYHLERIASILNSPIGYGVRLEFLDIELSKTEQLSYFAHKDNEYKAIQSNLSDLLGVLNQTGSLPNISTDKLKEFKETLETIVGDRNSIFVYGNSMIDRLHVPLKELKEFQEVLSDLTGADGSWLVSSFGLAPLQKLHVPVQALEDFRDILYDIVGDNNSWMVLNNAPINKLYVPLKELEQYNETLDDTLEKLKEIEEIRQRTIK